jgi:hypothetical protein
VSDLGQRMRMLAASFPDRAVLIGELLPRICSSKSNSYAWGYEKSQDILPR